jgi:hypothetical protein
MKTFIIDKENLSSVLESLWEKAKESNTQVTLNSVANQITIVRENELIAVVGVAEVVDEYDLIRELFN